MQRSTDIIVRNFKKGDKVVRVTGRNTGIIGYVAEVVPNVEEAIAVVIRVRLSKRDFKNHFPWFADKITRPQRAGHWRLINE